MNSETKFEIASKIGLALNGSWDHNGLARASKESLEGILDILNGITDLDELIKKKKYIICSSTRS